MSRLTFTLRGEPDQRLDLSALTPDRLAGLSQREIAALVISTTRQTLSAGDVFRVSTGDAADIRFAGGHERLDNVGAVMTGGRIVVEGDAGMHAGDGMSGGKLVIEGDSGCHAGTAMTGGTVEVGGDAGDFLGGCRTGEKLGMNGGLILVRGNAGARCGDRMRRGIIAVQGDCGPLAGSRMIAGSILAGGRLGERAGSGMKRGTIIAGKAATMLPTFNDCGVTEFAFAALYSSAFEQAGIPARGFQIPVRFRRFNGDMAALGKGEILLPAG